MRFQKPLALCLAVIVLASGSLRAESDPFALNLPKNRVPDRYSRTGGMGANKKETWGEFEGPGCIRHIWMTLRRPELLPMVNRKVIIRIYFDDSPTPNVEAPVGDFFGVMHGVPYYDLNTSLLSVKAWSGYNCYFAMPFARKARIELENGPEDNRIYLQVDWERYPDQALEEERRFCAQWRREMPTQRYGEDFLMLDANGPGQLIGFVYGVRLIDNVDRWSHGGAENIYIDGLGEHPAYIRGIGGEDTFGTSYGGVLHPPENHLFAGMPYYALEDTGEARGAQRVVGYRFFIPDPISFKESLHMRFGCMENDICAMIYWYQNGAPRRYVNLPPWKQLLPGTELKKGTVDLPLPDNGSWLVGPLQDNKEGAAVNNALVESMGTDRTFKKEEWVRQSSDHGFSDFNHVLRPNKKGVGAHHVKKAAEVVTVVETDRAMTVKFRLAWDDHLTLRVNDGKPIDLGTNTSFRQRVVEIPLKKGRNLVSVTLSNEDGTNHGGWAFAFRATAPDGSLLVPHSDKLP